MSLIGLQECMALLQIDYKLKRGQWRPRLLNYAKEQTAAAVSEASQRAFAEVAQAGGSTEKMTAAMTILTALKACSLNHFPSAQITVQEQHWHAVPCFARSARCADRRCAHRALVQPLQAWSCQRGRQTCHSCLMRRCQHAAWT